MGFVRCQLGFPVPKVYAWNASRDNDVGWEYIIMEKCSGEYFALHVDELAQSPHVINGLAKFQRDMSEIKFSAFGSIYFKEDVDESLRARPLYALGVLNDACSERFRIGPSVERQLYRGERHRMEIDRGPCKPFDLLRSEWLAHFKIRVGSDVESYIRAFSDAEIKWLGKFATSPKAQIQNGAHHSPASHIHSLERWNHLVPAILPTQSALCHPTLSHSDLSGANILVSRDNSCFAISGIIDWQGASIRPLFDIFPSPFLMTQPGKVREIDVQRGSNGQAHSGETSTQEVLTERYVKSLFRLSPLLYNVLSSAHLEKLRAAKYYSSHSWSDGLPLLNEALIAIGDDYGKGIPLHDDYRSCPVTFTPEEREKNDADLKFHRQEALLEHLADRFLSKHGITWEEDGSVPAHQYDAAQKAVEELYDIGTKVLSGERLRAVDRAWPYRKGKFTHTAELCE